MCLAVRAQIQISDPNSRIWVGEAEGGGCLPEGSEEIKVVYHPCRVPCPSVQLWHGTVAAGYGDGQVRLYEASTGTLHVQISAHARAICALDLAPEVGKVSLLLHPYVPMLLVLGH